MAQQSTTTRKLLKALRVFAAAYPDVQEGIACEGTALEKITLKVKNKAFLFLGTTNVMMKLGDSLAEAKKRAAKEPGIYKVGANGWATVTMNEDGLPPLELLKEWIDESYRLLAGSKMPPGP